jgi:DNA-directed RNA polymerase subunit RPC12/RpoP
MKCPRCSKAFENIPAEWDGKKVKCEYCQHTFIYNVKDDIRGKSYLNIFILRTFAFPLILAIFFALSANKIISFKIFEVMAAAFILFIFATQTYSRILMWNRIKEQKSANIRKQM